MKLKQKIAKQIKKKAFFINNWNIEEGSKPGTYSINLTINDNQDYDLVIEKLKSKNYDFDIISTEDIKVKDIPSSNSLNALSKLDREVLMELYNEDPRLAYQNELGIEANSKKYTPTLDVFDETTLEIVADIFRNTKDFPNVESVVEALRSLNTNKTITDAQYDYIMKYWNKFVEEYTPKEASVNKKAEDEVDEFANLPTSLKEQTSRPDKFTFTDTDVKPAEGELLEKLQELDRLKSAKAALDVQLKQIEENYRKQVELAKQEGKEVENKVQTDNILNEIAKLAKATNSKVISYGDKLITLKEETKKQPFKPTPLWKINKLLEKFGEQAKEYLDKAIDGAQNMATTSKIKQLIMWKDTRKKTSAVEDNALLNELKDLYIDMKNLYVNVAKADQVVDQVI